MPPKIELTTQPVFGMYEDKDSLYGHVQTLIKMSKPSCGNSELKIWTSIVLGERYYGSEFRVAAVVYSPYLMGREFDLKNWGDCTQLYFEFFEEYKKNWGGETNDDFNKFHDYYCPWKLKDILAAWEASKQNTVILKNIELQTASAVIKKI